MSSAPKAKYLKLSEIPPLYSISRNKLYRMKDRGLIKIHKVMGSSLVNVEELEEVIAAGAS